jgi:hypothetical protein
MDTPTDSLSISEDTRKHMSGPWRVWEIALYRMNNWGHAPFGPGELATLACGKDTPSNRAMVHRWIRVLAEMGRIKPEGGFGSTQLCIIVNHLHVKRDSGRASSHLCSEPAHFGYHKRSWPDARTWDARTRTFVQTAVTSDDTSTDL